VSTSPQLFIEMATEYFAPLSQYFGGLLNAQTFIQYTSVIARVRDSQREDFIKYILRPCRSDDVNSEYDKMLVNLPRLGLDPANKGFELPRGSSLKDWQEVEDWVSKNVKQ
jgi:hypothetical protein